MRSKSECSPLCGGPIGHFVQISRAGYIKCAIEKLAFQSGIVELDAEPWFRRQGKEAVGQ